MSRIAVTGAAGPVGRRVCALALTDPEVTEVIAIDRRPIPEIGEDASRLTRHRLHLRDADLDDVLAGVDTVCHLAGSDPLQDTAPDHDLHTTSRVLAAVERCGIDQLIVRTSATVYGAWPENPVPLTEADAARPNPDSPWVLVRAELEDRVREFADRHDEVAVAVLRPCVTVSEDGPDELGRVLATARRVSSAEGEGPVQFVHADDVAAAVDVVRRTRSRGVLNVAPDGWLSADQTRALVGGEPRVELPEDAARRLSAFSWRFRLAPTPPGFVPFVTQPWVVANDRLRSLGWKPAFSSDEAFVAAHEAAPWAQISPKARQELALGASVVAIVGAAAAAGVLLTRRLRRRA